MTDSLTVFGTDYTNVTGIKAKGTGNGTLTYIRPQGNLSITQNTASGSTLDVTQYATATVNVPTSGSDVFVVTVSYNDQTEMYEPDCTYAEVVAAYNANKTIIMQPSGEDDAIAVDGEIINGDDGVFLNYSVLVFTSRSSRTEELYAFLSTGLTLVISTAYSQGSGTPSLQSKSVSYTPTETAQSATVSADSGYDGLSSVDVSVGAISSTYVGSGITQRSSSDLTASGATVTVPAGYYSAQASKAVASGTAGTPTASKGSVSNHSVSVTPSVTNQTGYITGGTKTGTAVTVSASELVDGTLAINSSGTKDVTNYASASVAAGGATASATKGSVSNHSVTVTPSVTKTAGYIAAGTANGTAVTVSASELVSGSETKTANGTYDVTNLASLVVAIDYSTIHTGSSAPTSSQGANGDVWLVTS